MYFVCSVNGISIESHVERKYCALFFAGNVTQFFAWTEIETNKKKVNYSIALVDFLIASLIEKNSITVFVTIIIRLADCIRRE